MGSVKPPGAVLWQQRVLLLLAPHEDTSQLILPAQWRRAGLTWACCPGRDSSHWGGLRASCSGGVKPGVQGLGEETQSPLSGF